MGNNPSSRERETKLKTLEIKNMFKKYHSPSKCLALARKYVKEKIILPCQMDWLAGEGCLGPEMKKQHDTYNNVKKYKDETKD